jgi:predicted esterase
LGITNHEDKKRTAKGGYSQGAVIGSMQSRSEKETGSFIFQIRAVCLRVHVSERDKKNYNK